APLFERRRVDLQHSHSVAFEARANKSLQLFTPRGSLSDRTPRKVQPIRFRCHRLALRFPSHVAHLRCLCAHGRLSTVIRKIITKNPYSSLIRKFWVSNPFREIPILRSLLETQPLGLVPWRLGSGHDKPRTRPRPGPPPVSPTSRRAFVS